MQRVARVWLIAVSFLDGVAGLVCGPLLIARPDGSLLAARALLPVIKTLPLADVFFRDLFWVGVAMLLVLALPNLLAAALLLRRDPRQYRACLAASALLVAWSGFEMRYMFNAAAFGYFVAGLISVAVSLWMLRAAPGASV